MKIVVIHASAGAGHLKAAEAIRDGLKKYTSHDVRLVDALDLTKPLFKKLYRKGYFFLISKIPWIWQIAFYMLDTPFLQPLIKFFRRGYNALNCAGVQKFFIEEQFDYIFSTHFMPNEIASSLKEHGKISSVLITAVTDYDVHRIWLQDHVDKYAVASDWTKDKLVRIGIPDGKIVVTGVPTNEKFSSEYDTSAIRGELGLDKDKFTVLIATGSFGIGPIEQIIQELGGEFQVVVVCGHSQTLYNKLTQQNYPSVKVMGLVDNMYELMAASDVMITKPGGLSISEALVRHLPMIFFSAIPGQETHNVMVLKEHGIGISRCTIPEMAAHLRTFRQSEKEYISAVEKTKALARPQAVVDIISLIDNK